MISAILFLTAINLLVAFYMEERDNVEELDGSAVRALGVRSLKLSNVHKGQSSDE
jgi:hypothetical protein